MSKKNYYDRCVTSYAIHDITEQIKEDYKGFHQDYILYPTNLITKKNRYLNRLLGLNSINHLNNKNGKPKT